MLQTRLYNTVILFVILFSFVSCGSIHSSKTTTGNKEENTSDQMKISRLESELLVVKENQTAIKTELKNAADTIHDLNNDVLTLKQKLLSLEKNRAATNPVQQKIESTHPADLYKKARNLIIEEDYQKAATLFTEFYTNHPENTLADNAVYWLGECYYSLGDYKKATLIFKDLTNQYPKSEKIPDAILKIGYSYLSLDDSNRAHHYLKQVIKEYPFSFAAEKAQKKLGDFE